MAEAVITLENVTKILAKRQILKNISFIVDLPDLISGSLHSLPLQMKASAAQKPTFSWWLHALLSG